jgi:hypothetical protein
VGPRPFEADDGRVFFGRDSEVEDLVALTLSNQVVLVYAASGAGKSSLLNAAFVHRLERDEEFEVLPVGRLRGLREEVAADHNVFVAGLLSSLEPEGSNAESLHAYLQERSRQETTDGFVAPRALVIDQFEELFTAYPERWHDRPGFFHDLAVALRNDPLLRVVLSLREDFLGQLDPYARLLPEGFRARYRLDRLRRDAALRAVSGPARVAECPFGEGVAEQLVEDLRKVHVETEHGPREVIDEFVEPVQLQVVAHTLWWALPDGASQITDEHRQRFGNVDEVLRDFYDHAISAAASAAHTREDSLRVRFARAFITSMGTRGTVFWTRNETGGIPARAIDELDARHLIRAELRARARWYELTHDRLIEPIRASNRARELRRRERRRRRGIVGAVLLVVLAASSTAALLLMAGSANSNWASSLAAIASRPADVGGINSITFSNGGRALLVVGDQGSRTLRADDLHPLKDFPPPRALHCDPTTNVWQRWALVERGGITLEARVDGCNVMQGQLKLSSNPTPLVASGPRFSSIALSREARYVAFTDPRGRITIKGTNTSNKISLVYKLPNGVRLATPAFGADEHHVLFVASDGAIYRASTIRHEFSKLFRLSPETTGIAVDPDGGLIAAFGGAGELSLFDRNGMLIGALPERNLVAAAFSPSGNRLATVDRDGTVRVWRTRPDLIVDRTRLTTNHSGSTVVAEIRNAGSSRSSRTTVQSGSARVEIPALDAGASTVVRLSVPTPPRGIPLLVRVHPSLAGEWSKFNNNQYVWAPGDTRAQIVAAALTGASRGHEIRYVTLQAQAFQGVLDGVELPDVPRTANSSMFATWCYWQARVPDPNGQNYKTAGVTHLEEHWMELSHGRRRKKPQPGDLVYYADAPIAIYVGDQEVVGWKGPANSLHPAIMPLGHPAEIWDYLN